jgi:hypothetical protein
MVLHGTGVAATSGTRSMEPGNPTQVQQSQSSETKGPVYVSDEEEFEISGSRGTAHLVMKFEGSKKECTMTVVPVHLSQPPYPPYPPCPRATHARSPTQRSDPSYRAASPYHGPRPNGPITP